MKQMMRLLKMPSSSMKQKSDVLVDPTKPIKRMYDEKVAATNRNARGQGGSV